MTTVTFVAADIDECAEGTDLCDHDCSNTNGSYTCSCQTGYIIDEDGYDCDGTIYIKSTYSSGTISLLL